MTIARRRFVRPAVLGGVVVLLAPLVAAATSDRDGRSLVEVYLTALGWIAAIIAAGALFIGFEVQRHRRFRALAEPARHSTTGSSEPDQSIDSRVA